VLNDILCNHPQLFSNPLGEILVKQLFLAEAKQLNTLTNRNQQPVKPSQTH
jgi:hypothetical protein